MTLAISIDRYLGICHPLLNERKAWFYIVPVILISFLIVVPRFLEIKITLIEEFNNTETGTYTIIFNFQVYKL